MTTIIMVHGVSGTAEGFSRLAPAFRDKGWRVETPTLRPDKRTLEAPPADLPKLRLKDYVDDVEALARAIEAETGVAPVLFGHSMGGLLVQKVLERGVGRAGVLITPASPAGARSGGSFAQAFTFANVLFSGKPETKAHKIWKTGFSWGVLNCVPQAKHAGIYAGIVYDSGGVYEDLAYPDRDPSKTAYIDENRITAPILVIGGGRDRATPIGDVRKVGEKYARVGGELRIYPENGHWIVDEPGTDQVIADIAAWLEKKDLTPAKPTAAKTAAPARSKAAPAAAPAEAAPAAKATAAKPKAAKPKAAPAPKAAAASAAKAAPPAKAAPTAKPKPKPSPKAPPAKPKTAAPAKTASKPVAKAPAKAAAAKAPAKPAAKAKTTVRKPKSS
ncbi:alpha/beta hydrolase [Caulobacter mirabilis]|uniref:Arylesterase n=1 Tax=Caulobacter mirabilis TaxID=69666 RepID=A0A2D2AT75_9CAUL|nr:alpha/beta fold hydrolase [Caulobacter mirabilis]ATQ41210.1 arylesterase [Caulobacter mirabilis]